MCGFCLPLLFFCKQKCLFKRAFFNRYNNQGLPLNTRCEYFSFSQGEYPHILIFPSVNESPWKPLCLLHQSSSNKSLCFFSSCVTSNEMSEVIRMRGVCPIQRDLSPCHLPSSSGASRASLGARRLKIREKVLCFDSSSKTAGHPWITKGYEENWRPTSENLFFQERPAAN